MNYSYLDEILWSSHNKKYKVYLRTNHINGKRLDMLVIRDTQCKQDVECTEWSKEKIEYMQEKSRVMNVSYFDDILYLKQIEEYKNDY